MMRFIVLTIIGTICLWGTALSQSGKIDSVDIDCEHYPWSKNSLYLAKGLECLEELENERARHNATMHMYELCKLNVSSLEQDVQNLENIVNASERNEDAAFSELSKCNEENINLKKDLEKEERRKKWWRGTSTALGIVVVLLGTVQFAN